MCIDIVIRDGVQVFVYVTERRTYKNNLSNIILFEKEGRNVYVLAKDGTRTEISCTVREAFEMLGKCGFGLVNRGVIVNYSHVQELKGSEILMDDGTRVFISKTRQKEVREGLIEYLY